MRGLHGGNDPEHPLNDEARLGGAEPIDEIVEHGFIIAQKIPNAIPEANDAPSSSHGFNSRSGICFGLRISSGVCACVQMMMGSAIGLSRQPVAMRSICCAAFRPSLPAQIIV